MVPTLHDTERCRLDESYDAPTNCPREYRLSLLLRTTRSAIKTGRLHTHYFQRLVFASTPGRDGAEGLAFLARRMADREP